MRETRAMGKRGRGGRHPGPSDVREEKLFDQMVSMGVG